ncbi:general stress protein CsbD [Streptomyces sp. CB00455]|uniref:CsbD family protein n=1 Tax=Streptomyces sp. CB00455 TaxID=1703927 RepID=UPI00093E6528|nr:CsbD family protein [Streptomyces sp. CB00455]OKK22024.1 general stress protein CsbD [Streptomyces sp. CB00455]
MAQNKGAADKIKGKGKEAVGKLTGNERMKAEGRTDQAKGKAKEAAGNAKDTAAGMKDSITRDDRTGHGER